MSTALRLGGLTIVATVAALACGHSSNGDAPADTGDAAPPNENDSGSPPPSDASVVDTGSDSSTPAVDTLDANRDRLLGTYVDYLQAHPTPAQSTGLDGSVKNTCDLWSRLVPSSQDVFRTLTARMQGSALAVDSKSMLSHITKVYRIAGGQDATASDPGSCGGGEYNRMIMSMDTTLHTSLLAANAAKGAKGPSGKVDIQDIATNSDNFWRDSHDLGGPHGPFDLSDETDPGAPRGQVQYFKSATTGVALQPLGRQDLTTLVDPYAIEMDQDYDCPHNSNPRCSYTFYGSACLPQSSKLGVDIYTAGYGSYEPSWVPSACLMK